MTKEQKTEEVVFEALKLLHDHTSTAKSMFWCILHMMAVTKALYFVGTDTQYRELMEDATDSIIEAAATLQKQSPLTLAALRGENVDMDELAKEAKTALARETTLGQEKPATH